MTHTPGPWKLHMPAAEARKRLAELGMTQTDFAEATGYSPRAVRKQLTRGYLDGRMLALLLLQKPVKKGTGS